LSPSDDPVISCNFSEWVLEIKQVWHWLEQHSQTSSVKPRKHTKQLQ
jgi:hypothetical protein